MNAPKLPRKVRGVVLDMDGVLYRGNEATPGVQQFFNMLDARAMPYLLLTNNSTTLPSGYSDKLAAMGITVSPDAILTSGIVTRDYLTARYPRGTRIYGVSMEPLERLLLDGTGYVWDPDRPEVVISSGDFAVTYDKLRRACLAIRAGADWIATNTDKTLPTEAGLVPGAGALVAALVTATDREPLALGKPDLPMMAQALAKLGLDAHETVMIGDRLDTDILGGINVNMTTILVLTGVSTRAEAEEGTIKPDYIFDDLVALTAAFAE